MTGDNYGIQNHGRFSMGGGNAFGPRAKAVNHAPVPAQEAPVAKGEDQDREADVGVITMLSVETQAVVEILGRQRDYRVSRAREGGFVYRATMSVPGRPVRVMLRQALDPGQRSAAAAYHALGRPETVPPVVTLVGIAGAVHPDLSLGDVAVSDEIVYYELKKERAGETLRRGQVHRSPARMRRGLNDFFTAYGEPGVADDPNLPGHRYRIWRGPIGSGETVVAYEGSGIQEYLRRFNDKVVAVEMEAGGLAQAYHEAMGTADNAEGGWLTVRGISDLADGNKNDRYHGLAAARAAAVWERLLPYLATAT